MFFMNGSSQLVFDIWIAAWRSIGNKERMHGWQKEYGPVCYRLVCPSMSARCPWFMTAEQGSDVSLIMRRLFGGNPLQITIPILSNRTFSRWSKIDILQPWRHIEIRRKGKILIFRPDPQQWYRGIQNCSMPGRITDSNAESFAGAGNAL